MKPCSDFYAELVDFNAHCVSASNPPGRAVECGQQTIAGCVYLATLKALDLLPKDFIETNKQIPPGAVSALRQMACRVNDVDEKHCGQDSIYTRSTPRPGDELLDGI